MVLVAHQALAFSTIRRMQHVSPIGTSSCSCPLTVPPQSYQHKSAMMTRNKIGELLLAQSDSESSLEIAALPPSNADSNANDLKNEILSAATGNPTSASVATMINQESKRILIEELDYRRRDVERIKFDLAPFLIERRVRCPKDGMPNSWCRSDEELMMDKLEQESKYPLKLPLIGVSLILFGKGFGDALITLIKVNIDFPGASLVEEFMGIPVLLIDAVCTVLGASLAWWTWTNMK
eukprot:scaffold2689_cov267-Chaetoceros_neogracile.AAC.8